MLVGRHAADGSGPLGGLLDHVVAGAHDVVAVGLVLALGALGHGLLVEADAVGVQEVGVAPLVDDELVGDGGDERGVGARVDGQPLLGVARVGVVQARVDDVDLARGVLAAAHPVMVRDGAALAGLGRARAEAQDQVGVLHARQGRAARAAVDVGRDPRDLGGRIAAVVAEVAAEQVHHAAERAGGGAAHAGGVVDIDGLVAVGVDGVLELVGDGLKGLVPADLLVLAVAALGALDALHRVVDAVGVVHPAAVAAAAQAGAGLRVVEVVRVVRVRVDPEHLAVLDVELEGAAAGAVDGAVTPNLGDAFLIGGRRLVGHRERGAGRRACGCQACQHTACRHERAAGNRAISSHGNFLPFLS